MTDYRSGPFRWAILGTGSVSRKFALDLRQLGGAAEIACVASRDPENARRFADTFGGVPVADYEAAAVADVDALYIATPPALHEPHALMGIRAGKAVLVEKPFASDAGAARRIAAEARAQGVFCMEALWTRFQPLAGEIRSLVASGKLGEIRGFDARFMGANRPDSGVSLFDPEQGGALIHRGIYPLSMAHFLLGPVAEMQSMARLGEAGVDEDSVLILRHEGGALSTLRASLRAAGPEGATLWGTAGTLHIEGPIWRPTGALLQPVTAAGAPGAPRRLEAFRESHAGQRISHRLGQIKRLVQRSGTRVSAPVAGNGYHYEAQAVMQAVAKGLTEEPRMTLDDSIALVELMDRARALRSPEARS